jgi:hypothetical protein
MVPGSACPQAHWTPLRTTNVVESPLATGRRRTTAAKRSKQVEHATAVIGTVLLVAESPFRRPDSAERLGEVAEGARDGNGARVRQAEEPVDQEAAA